jgi:hypothetical protein
VEGSEPALWELRGTSNTTLQHDWMVLDDLRQDLPSSRCRKEIGVKHVTSFARLRHARISGRQKQVQSAPLLSFPTNNNDVTSEQRWADDMLGAE